MIKRYMLCFFSLLFVFPLLACNETVSKKTNDKKIIQTNPSNILEERFVEKNFEEHLDKIDGICFTDFTAPSDAVDVSAEKDNSVLAWLEELDSGELLLYVTTANGKTLFAPEDCSNLFNYLEDNHELVVIYFDNFDTSNVKNMSSMFRDCMALQSLDISNWDTSNVRNMAGTFSYCEDLQKLNISNWDTSNVTNMSALFNNCKSLQNLDVSNWNTSNVENMSVIFQCCENIQELDISSWDTSNVTSLVGAFCFCYKLQSLDISNWDVSKVEDLDDKYSDIFTDCPAPRPTWYQK